MGLQCEHWVIKCTSHTPYLTDLISCIPLNCEILNIEVDNGGLGHIASMQQIISAKNLELKTSDESEQPSVQQISNKQLLNFQANYLRVFSSRITEEGINELIKQTFKNGEAFYAEINVQKKLDNSFSKILDSFEFEQVDGTFYVASSTKSLNLRIVDQTVIIEQSDKK
uniref:Uncharacterized protein n=1 Tax=Caenorhabditis japonica TaxID=281687 RepID=A0A8R1I3D8_CAEJA